MCVSTSKECLELVNREISRSLHKPAPKKFKVGVLVMGCTSNTFKREGQSMANTYYDKSIYHEESILPSRKARVYTCMTERDFTPRMNLSVQQTLILGTLINLRAWKEQRNWRNVGAQGKLRWEMKSFLFEKPVYHSSLHGLNWPHHSTII